MWSLDAAGASGLLDLHGDWSGERGRRCSHLAQTVEYCGAHSTRVLCLPRMGRSGLPSDYLGWVDLRTSRCEMVPVRLHK